MTEKVSLFDCTLRDGGFVNNWNFGHSTIVCMFQRLVQAQVDYIEVGFLDDNVEFDINRTTQPNTKCYDIIFENYDKGNSKVAAMIDYGNCDLENIALAENSFIDIIRVIFKKNNAAAAVKYAEQISKKGYKVCLQLVSITSYSDSEIYDFIKIVNAIKPFSVAMVDTYGLMHKKEMFRYFEILDQNLDLDIVIGYHSHNNFQLGYANEIEMLTQKTKHKLMVDGTVYGMGKSAGNAPLELLAVYLNENYNTSYDLNQILEIIDTVVLRIFQKSPWGYSLKYFMSASNDCHPEYISYLLSKHNLSIKSINEIVNKIETDEKLNFDDDYIEKLYQEYQTGNEANDFAIENLKMQLENKRVLLLGPGKSLLEESEKIEKFVKSENPVVIAVSCIPQKYKLDYVFISNSKKYNLFYDSFKTLKNKCKIIATSNITPAQDSFDFVFNYADLQSNNINRHYTNSLGMILNAMHILQVKDVALAGFDGYVKAIGENYYDEFMDLSPSIDHLEKLNSVIKNEIEKFGEISKITFITKSLYK